MRISKQDFFFLRYKVRTGAGNIRRVHKMTGGAGPGDWNLSTNPQLYLVGMWNEQFVGNTSVRVRMEYSTDNQVTWLEFPPEMRADTGVVAIADTGRAIFWNWPFPASEKLLKATHIGCNIIIAGAAATAGIVTVGYKDGPAEIRDLGVQVANQRQGVQDRPYNHLLGEDRDPT